MRERLLFAVFDDENSTAFAVLAGLATEIAQHWGNGTARLQNDEGRSMICRAQYRTDQKKMELTSTSGPWDARVETGEAGAGGALAFTLAVEGLSLYTEHLALTKLPPALTVSNPIFCPPPYLHPFYIVPVFPKMGEPQ